MVDKKGWSTKVAALTLIFATLILMFPTFLLLQCVFSQIASIIQSPSELIKVFNKTEVAITIKEQWGIDLLSEKNVSFLAAKVGVIIPQVLTE